MTTAPAEVRWLSPTDIARQLGCSNDTVLRAIARGDLTAVRYGRLFRVNPTDLDRFLTRYRSTA